MEVGFFRCFGEGEGEIAELGEVHLREFMPPVALLRSDVNVLDR